MRRTNLNQEQYMSSRRRSAKVDLFNLACYRSSIESDDLITHNVYESDDLIRRHNVYESDDLIRHNTTNLVTSCSLTISRWLIERVIAQGNTETHSTSNTNQTVWTAGVSGLARNWVRFALNGTNLGLLKNQFQYILEIGSDWPQIGNISSFSVQIQYILLNLIWKSPRFVPFEANLTKY